jgi:hypothetical protein
MAKKADIVQERQVRDARLGPAHPDAMRPESAHLGNPASGSVGSAPELPLEPASVVMRDESDEIIDDLKRQLAALQSELSQVRSDDSDGPEGPVGKGPRRAARKGSRAKLVEEFNAGFAPHLAERLQVPAEELTQRLGRLIEQVSDPALKAELELARETAFFLSSTFHRIQDNHRLLTESLVAERIGLLVTEFFEQVAHTVEQRGLARPQIPAHDGAAGEHMTASPQAAATVLSTLSELAGAVFGGTPRMSFARGTGSHLRLRVETDRPWRGVTGDEVSSVVFRPGVRAASVVDVLYIEKIIELQGGRLSFYRESGQVMGFEVLWPFEAQ